MPEKSQSDEHYRLSDESISAQDEQFTTQFENIQKTFLARQFTQSMATINEEPFLNIIRTSMNHLKTFAETLNAELAERDEDDNDRSRYKDDFKRIIESFVEGEAQFKKNNNAIKEIKKKLRLDDTERISEQDIDQEIKSVLKIVQGTERHRNEDQPPDVDGKEFHLARQLERVKDILDEYNPLHFGDEEEIDESEEERQSRQLERAQKKAMKKLEQRLSLAHQDDNVDTTDLFQEETNVSDSSDDGEMDYENLNQPKNVDTQVQARARRNADIKLKEKFDNYRKELADSGSVDMKQVFEEMNEKIKDVTAEELTVYSPQNIENILEMFGNEAILVVKSTDNFVDPLSKQDIRNPVRNKLCHHVYEKETMFHMLEKKKQMRCPALGCSRQVFTIDDLEDDEETAAKISQRASQRQTASQQETEEMGSDEEEGVENTTIDPELEDTQSQELF